MSRWNVLASEWLEAPATMRPLIRVEPELWRQGDRLERELRAVDALLVRNQTRVDVHLLEVAPRLRVVGRLGAGLDNVDVAAVRRRGGTVVYAPEGNTRSVAEFCLGQIMALLKGFPQAAASTARGEWNRTAGIGREVSGCTVGIVGFGRIGQTLGAMLSDLGAKVLAHSRRPFASTSRWEWAPLDVLLARSDVVSINVPGGPATQGLVGARELGLMKEGALLVNSSRGGVVDEEALVDALHSGRLAGAAVDVRAHEPPEYGALEQLPNVLLTPHIAAATAEAQTRVATSVIADVLAVLAGDEPRWPAP